MLGNRCTGDRKRFRDLTGTESARLQHIHNLTADGIGKGFECVLNPHDIASLSFNLLVK
jgi:hypothetical protein